VRLHTQSSEHTRTVRNALGRSTKAHRLPHQVRSAPCAGQRRRHPRAPGQIGSRHSPRIYTLHRDAMDECAPGSCSGGWLGMHITTSRAVHACIDRSSFLRELGACAGSGGSDAASHRHSDPRATFAAADRTRFRTPRCPRHR